MRALGLAAVAVSVVLAGCGAQAVEDTLSLDEIAAATRADPYRFELTLKTEGMSESFTGTATGSADPAADRGVIRYSFVDEGEKMTVEVRRLDGETYTRFAARELSGGWTKEFTTDADETIGPFGMFSEPHRVADALARHGRDVEAETGEEIDGIATTHYRASAPTIEILGGELKGERRAELESEIRETGSETTQVEAWAGADGLLRKLQLSIPITEDGETGRLLTEARFYDFGTAVDVDAPPASEIEKSSASSGESSGSTGHCLDEARPHSAEAVTAALRAAEFAVSASCIDKKTTIFAYPDDARDREAVVVCFIAASPRAVEDEKGAIVAGNVSCLTRTDASRKLVQPLLRGLERG